MQCSVPFVQQNLCLQRWDNGLQQWVYNGCTVRFVYSIFEYSFVLGIFDSLGFRIFISALTQSNLRTSQPRAGKIELTPEIIKLPLTLIWNEFQSELSPSYWDKTRNACMIWQAMKLNSWQCWVRDMMLPPHAHSIHMWNYLCCVGALWRKDFYFPLNLACSHADQPIFFSLVIIHINKSSFFRNNVSLFMHAVIPLYLEMKLSMFLCDIATA